MGAGFYPGMGNLFLLYDTIFQNCIKSRGFLILGAFRGLRDGSLFRGGGQTIFSMPSKNKCPPHPGIFFANNLTFSLIFAPYV